MSQTAAPELFRQTFDLSPDALLVVEADGAIVAANASAAELFGYARNELIGLFVEALLPAELAVRHVRHRADYLAAPAPRQMGPAGTAVTARCKDGTLLAVDIMLGRLEVEPAAVLCAVRDARARLALDAALRARNHELERLHDELRRYADSDPLTGLHNRRSFTELAGRMLSEAKRSGRPVSMLMLDLDHFKRINDSLGHLEGDRILMAVAAALRQTVRDNEVVARYGGEELAVALADADQVQSLSAAERFRAAIAAAGGAGLTVTASVGAATLTPDLAALPTSEALLALLGRADQALYAAKRAGRNRCCQYAQMQRQPEAPTGS